MTTDQKGRPRPPGLRALGAAEPPHAIIVDSLPFSLVEVFKHDSLAATALYENLSAGKKIVCKFNRIQPVLGIPMAWLGRWLAGRERHFYALLGDLPCISKGCGPVFHDGTVLPHAHAHYYIEGRVLRKEDRLPASFFAALASQLESVHSRGVYLLDLNKRENILMDEAGQPQLIDFQIAVQVRPEARFPFANTLRQELQRCDDYHLMKHRIKLGDGSETDLPDAATPPFFVQIHRFVYQPLIRLRRAFLVKLGVRTGQGKAQSEHFLEVGLRDEDDTGVQK